jgi:hypothetical protein
MVKNNNITILGDSGSPFYSPSGKMSKPIPEKLADYAGFPNRHDLTEVGVHPLRWVQLLREWKARFHVLSVSSMNRDDCAELRFGSDFVVLVFDAHNGLQMHPTKYTGLDYTTKSGKTMFQEYDMLMKELEPFSQVVYGYSACPETFGMDSQLERDRAPRSQRHTRSSRIPLRISGSRSNLSAWGWNL